VFHFVAMVSGDALQPANRDRLAIDARPPAGRLARSIAGAAEDPGKDVGFAIEEIGLGESVLRNQSDVLRNVRVRGAGPLTIDDTVVVIRSPDIGWLHVKTTL